MDWKSSKREIATPSEEHGAEGSYEKKNPMTLNDFVFLLSNSRTWSPTT